MDKVKYLLKNMSFLALSSLGIKLISFFLIPLYTSILTTSEYGTYDLYNTTISLLIPFLTLNIKESTIRFALSDEYDKDEVFTISLNYSIKATVIFIGFIILNSYLKIIPSMCDYKLLIVIMFISQTINGIITNFTRGLDRLKDIAVSSVICSLSIVILNIITLKPLHMGLTGYFLANTIGPLVQAVYLFVISKSWKYIKFKKKYSQIKKEMVEYSVPMIANSTAWWINSVSDRYIIIWLCGVAENGIYSVANKIPSIVDVFQGIFSQAWTLSAVKEFDEEDKGGFFSNMFTMYNMCMTIMSGGVIAISRLLAKFLYANEFFMAWKYVPFLIIAVLFGALAGYCGAIFSAVKASKLYAYSTLVGAGVNIILNVLLVKPIGALGAAIATSISYTIIFILRLYYARKYINLKISWCRDWAGYIILFIQTICLLIFQKDNLEAYLIQVILIIILISLYGKQLYTIKVKISNLLNRKGR